MALYDTFTDQRDFAPCSVCGRLERVGKRGNVRTHYTHGLPDAPCPGSGKPPKESK